MRFGSSGDFWNPFSDEGVRHDELRTSIVTLLGDDKRISELLHVVTVDLLDIKPVSLETHTGVFALRYLRHRVERDRVRIIDQDQIIESEVTGESARLSSNPFLEAAVASETDDVLVKNAMLIGVKPHGSHFRGHGDADSVAHALAERSRGAFYSRCFHEFRMTRRVAMKLPKPLDLRHGQVVTAHMQPRV